MNAANVSIATIDPFRRIVFLCLFIGLMINRNAFAQTETDSIGVWQGSYVCLQGETQLRLTILPQEADPKRLAAYFYFTPRPEADDRSAGCFLMKEGEASVGSLQFTQVKWLRKPENYVMVDLSGKIDPLSQSYEGLVLGPGCGRFELKRVLKSADPTLACEPFSQ